MAYAGVPLSRRPRLWGAQRPRQPRELLPALDTLEPNPIPVLLSAEDADDDERHLDRLLDLLPDVPAGKLAIAELVMASQAEVAQLERAGVDAVLVTAGDIGTLVGDSPPEV